jgi:hypothetical protein
VLSKNRGRPVMCRRRKCMHLSGCFKWLWTALLTAAAAVTQALPDAYPGDKAVTAMCSADCGFVWLANRAAAASRSLFCYVLASLLCQTCVMPAVLRRTAQTYLYGSVSQPLLYAGDRCRCCNAGTTRRLSWQQGRHEGSCRKWRCSRSWHWASR